eukprot:1350337-Rhodomonas_salina.1
MTALYATDVASPGADFRKDRAGTGAEPPKVPSMYSPVRPPGRPSVPPNPSSLPPPVPSHCAASDQI